jgi:preprotein translocase subunit YajC
MKMPLSVLFFLVSFFLAAPVSVLGQAASGVQPPPLGLFEMIVQMIPMIAMMFVIFYVLVSRPQQKKLEEQDKLIKELKKGEEIYTRGGIIAKVVSVEESAVFAEISPGVKVKIEKSAVLGRV